MALDAGKMMIYLEELERYGVARAPDQGIMQVGPIIMSYGSRGPEGTLPAAHAVGRAHLVPGLFGAQCGLGSREPADDGGARRRRLRRQRPEDLDFARARLDPLLRAGAHRPAGEEAAGHQLPAGRPRKRPASRSARSATSPGTRSSARCSSTTCACRATRWSARSTRAGRWPRRCSASSASPSAARAGRSTRCSGWRR